MKFSDILIAQLKQHEGFIPVLYIGSADHLTIGYGHKATPDETKIYQKGGITNYDATILLQSDLSRICEELIEKIPWVVNLSHARRDAFYNMAYNLGAQGLIAFKEALAFAQNDQWVEVVLEIKKSKWCRQVTQRCQALTIQMATDTYSLKD